MKQTNKLLQERGGRKRKARNEFKSDMQKKYGAVYLRYMSYFGCRKYLNSCHFRKQAL